MALSGKYDFRGIKTLGAAGLRAALSSSPYTAWFLKLGGFSDLLLEFLVNWFTNKGLIVFNLGAIEVMGELDQRRLDAAFDKAFEEILIKGGRDRLTPEQKKAIDDEVIRAGRKFIVIGNPQ